MIRIESRQAIANRSLSGSVPFIFSALSFRAVRSRRPLHFGEVVSDALCSIASRSTWSRGKSCNNSRKTPLVHPNPTTLDLYPVVTCVSEDRVTTLYFSRIVPSRRKFSATVERNLYESRSAFRSCNQRTALAPGPTDIY